MNIAICDDELIARENIAMVIEDYILDKKLDINYELFESYHFLKNRIEEFDVFFMDYQMPEIDGMSFAKKIREDYGNSKTIIFVTSFSEIVYDSFIVNTHRFLLKPVEKSKIYEALDSSIINNSERQKLILKTDGFTDIINISDVFYIEVIGKECTIWLENDNISTHRTISSLEEELDNSAFFRIHRSYIVNMNKIKCFDSSRIELLNGKKLEISSRKYKNFCKEYLNMK